MSAKWRRENWLKKRGWRSNQNGVKKKKQRRSRSGISVSAWLAAASAQLMAASWQ
jgi:hypothetical protein